MTGDQRDHQDQKQAINILRDETSTPRQNCQYNRFIYPGIRFQSGKVETHFKASQFVILSLLNKAHRRGVLSQSGLFELKMARKKLVVHLQYEIPQLACELTKKDHGSKTCPRNELEKYQLKLLRYLRVLDRITHPKYRHTIQANRMSFSLADLIRHFKGYFNQLNF